MKLFIRTVLFLTIIGWSYGCSKDKGVNIFAIEDDMNLGKQMQTEIAADTTNYPVLSKSKYPVAYSNLERIRDTILGTGQLQYAGTFTWNVQIIHNDSIYNAFCCPGGYIYVYTGIIKFLDNEAEFAGVLGHEMAHADRRHSTQILTEQYGVQMLLSLLLGQNPSQVAQIVAGIANGLSSLAYSREMESEADKYAVTYLYHTTYHPPALGDFFTKIESAPNVSNVPQFLSTHPNPANRQEAINQVWQSLGGKSGQLYADRYLLFQRSLP